jgi:hypothetical protein
MGFQTSVGFIRGKRELSDFANPSASRISPLTSDPVGDFLSNRVRGDPRGSCILWFQGVMNSRCDEFERLFDSSSFHRQYRFIIFCWHKYPNVILQSSVPLFTFFFLFLNILQLANPSSLQAVQKWSLVMRMQIHKNDVDQLIKIGYIR